MLPAFKPQSEVIRAMMLEDSPCCRMDCGAESTGVDHLFGSGGRTERGEAGGERGRVGRVGRRGQACMHLSLDERPERGHTERCTCASSKSGCHTGTCMHGSAIFFAIIYN